MSRRGNRKEFKSTSVDDVRRMVQASNYSADKLQESESGYTNRTAERRADIKGTLAVAFGALVISALACVLARWS